jgi:hypothetical protein
VTNPPTGWDEGQKGREADALLALAEVVDAGQHSHDEVFSWTYHVLDRSCVRGRCDSEQCAQHRARALSHRVRGVVPVDRAELLADNAACRQAGVESLVPPGFLPALREPTAGARSDAPAREGLEDGRDEVERGGQTQ